MNRYIRLFQLWGNFRTCH